MTEFFRRLSAHWRIVVLVQVLVWIAVPWLVEGSIRLDVSEGVIGGPEWQLSYLRHPPFTTWLTGLISMTGAARYGVLFLTAQALSVGAFVIVALMLGRIEGRKVALVALFAGLASPFTTYVPLQINHNIGVMLFFALTLGAAWSAFEGGALASWLLFGLVVGMGVWAKYAIAHLVLPLALLFFAVPEWRRRISQPGPWLAGLLVVLVIAPHFRDVSLHGATTLSFATRTTEANLGFRLARFAEFTVDVLLIQISMGIIAVSAVGWPALKAAIRNATDEKTRTRFDLFAHVAAFGPVLVVLVAVPFGVVPRWLWITPFTPVFVFWWAHMAARARADFQMPRMVAAWAALALVLLGSYVGIRELAPKFARRPAYPEMDGPALARLAQDYWDRKVGPGHIPYIVSYNDQRGRQAAGSIAFDLPYRVRVMENGSLRDSRWIDPVDVAQRGALVVAPLSIPASAGVGGASVSDIETFERPMMRGAHDRMPFTFGLIRPKG